MPRIRVKVEFTVEVEAAFSEWRATLPPIEWQDIPSIQPIKPEQADSIDITEAHAHYEVGTRFVDFLAAQKIHFDQG